MARLERGKGKRQQVIEITRQGATLRTQENAGGDLRLPGYRRCSSAEAAQAAMEAEVRRHLADGMRPGDEAARTIAATMAAHEPASEPAFPIRRDLGVYNEATGFVCTSRRMAGRTLEEGSDAWMKAVARGDLLPLSLVQDDSFVLRVVAGAPLSEQERDEWVGRVEWHLNLGDGRLCVTGGAPFSNEDYDADEPYHEAFVVDIAVPKGRYRATLYTHAHGLNGAAVLDELAGGGYDSHEATASWWARTRPDEPMPDFDAEEDLVEFLLHLEPVEKAPSKRELGALPESGWFTGWEQARKPERCPRGIKGVDVLRRVREESGSWTYVRDVDAMLGESAPMTVTGGPLELTIDDLPSVARLGWFASRWVAFELRCTVPSGADVASLAWPPDVIGVVEDGVLRVLMSADVAPHELFTRLREMAGVVATMPSGTVLELAAAPTSALRGEPGDAGRMRFRGAVRSGTWTIDAAFPAVDAATLTAAVDLARAAAGDHDRSLAAASVFAQRFEGTWPVEHLGATGGIEDDDDDVLDEAPVRGPHVWSAPAGRAYHETMAMLVSDGVAEGISLGERTFRAERWPHVGDLVCDAFPNIALRGYARDGGTSWGVMLCSAPGEVQLLLATHFVDGTLLLTSAEGAVRDDPAAGILRTGIAGATTRVLFDAHAERLAVIADAHGGPRPTVATITAFAEALEPIVRILA